MPIKNLILLFWTRVISLYGSDTGSDTDNVSVVSLSTWEEDTEEEDKIQERSRNTGYSGNFHVVDGGYLLRRVILGHVFDI